MQEVNWLYELAQGVSEIGITHKKTRRGRRIPKEQRESFKTTISAHRLWGINWNATCKQLEIDKNTYYVLIDELVSEENEQEFKNRERMLHKILSWLEDDMRQAKVMFEKTGQPRFLELKIKATYILFKSLQSAGYLPNVQPTPIDTRQVVPTSPLINRDELLARAIKKLAAKKDGA